ncbi:hypothetical protein bAD24_III12025 [Burkholderia sp. AD24]|jgi:hypothetical protein|nr:hypothetical protein bAD24_III12025 [Burkholderia sp. AD24]
MVHSNCEELHRLRNVDASKALVVLASYAKRDRTFQPVKAIGTERWHVSAAGRDYEFLVNGPKFFDTRVSIGGGGAIDLVIYLYGIRFTEAVAVLRQRGL